MESAPAERARRGRWGGVVAVLFVLIAGGLAASGAAVAVGASQTRLTAQTMDTYRDTISAAIQDELGGYADALADVAAGIAVNPVLTGTDFRGLTGQLGVDRLAGSNGIVFVTPVSDDGAPAAQALWRSRGAKNLILYRSGSGSEHAFVIFSRAFAGAPQPVGRDLNQTVETADTLRIAAETGAFTVGRAHIQIRDRELPVAQQQMSFTMAMPVFAAVTTTGARPLRGWVVMGVRGGDFLRATLLKRAQGAVRVQLDDPAQGSALPIADVDAGTPLDRPALRRTAGLVVGHHTWQLTLTPTTQLVSTSDQWLSRWTLLGGISVTVLLGTLCAVLAGARDKALDKVDAATATMKIDIARRIEVEKELSVLAYRDLLTGLHNRKGFYDRIGHALKSHARAGATFAVFFIDLDGFKLVNDRFGHNAGDVVLKTVAARLTTCLRDSDTVARFGGDEFTVITEWLAAVPDVHLTAQRIVHAIADPIDVGAAEPAKVTASIGVALNRPGDDADDIVREADLAMYEAKTGGKSRHVLAGTGSGQVPDTVEGARG